MTIFDLKQKWLWRLWRKLWNLLAEMWIIVY